MPSGWSAARIASATVLAVRITAARSAAVMSKIVSPWTFGITSTCPSFTGLMSMKASVPASSVTRVDGIRPSRTWQKTPCLPPPPAASPLLHRRVPAFPDRSSGRHDSSDHPHGGTDPLPGHVLVGKTPNAIGGDLVDENPLFPEPCRQHRSTHPRVADRDDHDVRLDSFPIDCDAVNPVQSFGDGPGVGVILCQPVHNRLSG